MRAKRDRRTVGADPEAFSGGAYPRRSSRPQADPGAQSSRGGAVDSQYRRSVAHASPVVPELQEDHRRFQQWCENEVIRAAHTELANVLREQGSIDESECFIDATFASAKGGGDYARREPS